MTIRQFISAYEKMVTRVLRTMLQAQQANYEALSDRLAAVASLPWAHAPTAADELTQVVSMLRAERQRQGVSLQELQAATGISRSALSLVETQKNTNPNIATLHRIAEGLGKKLLVALVEAEDRHVPNATNMEERSTEKLNTESPR